MRKNRRVSALKKNKEKHTSMKKESLLIKNGTVITLGKKNKIIHNGAVFIEENIIKKIGKPSDLKDIEKPAEVIDAKARLHQCPYAFLFHIRKGDSAETASC
jgi:hypothetical protein